MDKFINYWKLHEVDDVLDLFTDNVEYWETPFNKVSDKSSLKKEWEYVKNQRNIEIFYDVFLKNRNKFSIIWKLKYLNEKNEIKIFSGVYLIGLNNDGKCNYFFHCCESKNN